MIAVVVVIMIMMATVGFVVLTSHPGAVVTPYKSTTTSGIPSQSMTNTSASGDTSTATTTVTSTSSAQIPLSLKAVASIPIANPSLSRILIAFDASNNYLYLANGTSTQSITVVDLSKNDSIIATIPLGNATGGLLYDPSNGYVYASQHCVPGQAAQPTGVAAVVINGTKIIAKVAGPCATGGLAYDPSDHHIFEATGGAADPDSLVNVIDDRSNTVVATIPVGNGLVGIAYDASNGMVYVADLSSGSVDVINPATNSVVGAVQVESGHPVYADDLVSYNPGNGLIYVTNGLTYDYNTEINGTTMVGNFTVPCSGGTGSEFDGFAYDSVRAISFMSACGTVVAANGTTNAELLSINVPGASLLVYDPSNYDVYAVANTGIVVISTTDG
jgi:YVTN family beta-propeller protein